MGHPERQFGDAELSAMLRTIDHRPPSVSADAVMSRVRRARMRHSALIAACALVSMATIATAAVPGTALNGFVRGLLGVSARHEGGSGQPSQVGAASPAASAAARGVGFVPGERANIVFRAAQEAGELSVRVGDVASVRITQTTAGGEARFDLTPDGVVVGNEGSTASYELVLPTSLARATVRVGSRAVVSKDRSELTCEGKSVREESCEVPLRP